MQTHITFKQLPFNPDSKNVIYIENEYDTEVNQYIQNNYNTIKEQFSHYGYNFIYMPLLVKDMERKGVFSYYAPYLSQIEKESLNISSNWLLEYLTSPTKADIQPSLIFDGSFAAENTNTYYCIPIRDYQYSQTNDFSELLNVILSQQDSMMCMSVDAFDIKEEEINNYNGFFEEENCLRQISTYEQEERRSTVKKSSESKQKEEKRNSVIFRRFKKGLDIIPGELFGSKASSKSEVCYDKAPIINPVPADYTFAEDSHALLDEVQKKIALLRQMGVNLAILEQLIHQEEKLSRMIITKKFDIILPD